MNLRDCVLDTFLKENGFCKFDLKVKAALPELQNVYNQYFTEKESDKGFYVTHNKDGYFDRTYEVHQHITNICGPYLKEYFEDFDVFAAHFVVKKAHGETGLQLHQDWNNVDERINQSVQVWIPLSLSYPENGGLGFFPKSHTFFNNFRSGSFGITHVDLESKLYDYLSYVRLFPGEAAVFYNNTFHCSFINSTPEDRIAVLLNLIPKEVETVYCHRAGDILKKYALSTISLFRNLPALEKGVLPESFELISSEPYTQIDNASVNADLLIEKIKGINEKKGLPADYEVKMYSIVKDAELEKQLNHEGYAVIQLLTDNEIVQIEEVFKKFFPERSKYKGSYNSLEHLSASDTLEAHYLIQSIITQRLDFFFKDAYSPVSLLYSKKPDGVLDIDWHSDPSFIINEQLEPIYGIWCSLYDIGAREGTLMVVPGSHRFIRRLHGTPYTWISPMTDYWRLLDKYGVQPQLKAGQAMLYDARIIHSSTVNLSKMDRDCLVMRVTGNRTKDFFNVLMEPENSMKGYMYRHGQEYFYGEVAKRHIGEIEEDMSEGVIHFFPYPVSQESIDNYFRRFKK